MNRTPLVVIVGIIVSLLVLPFLAGAQPTTSSSLSNIWTVISAIKQELFRLNVLISNLKQQMSDTHIESRIAIFNITTQTPNGVNISCNNDEIVTGGGTDGWGDTGNPGILEFYPINERTWHVRSSGGLTEGTLRLVCVKY